MWEGRPEPGDLGQDGMEIDALIHTAERDVEKQLDSDDAREPTT